MKLSQIAKAVAVVQPNHSILLYGPPKAGKTRLVGTAAKIPEVRRIFWFDGENGSETLLHMGLTEEEMDKVTVFKIRDTKDEPIFIETVLKAFTSKKPVAICDLHGRCDCAACKKEGLPATSFLMTDCTHNDLVVLDSGSALGDSAMAALCLGKDSMYKPGWDEYGIQGKWLSDILTVVQQATYTNFCFITHEICIENDEKKDQFYPLMGTKAFCMKAGKYFGTVAYVHKKLNKHAAGSSSTYLGDRVTGSRVNARIEKDADSADMKTILIEGGILRKGDMGVPEGTKSSLTVATKPVEMQDIPAAVKDQPLSLAERLKQKAAESKAKAEESKKIADAKQS
jgi:hypothetical protein